MACCVSIRGTVASRVAPLPTEPVTGPAADIVATVCIEHPSGLIDVRVETGEGGAELEVQRAGVVLTAREIMDGQMFVPQSLWPLSPP